MFRIGLGISLSRYNNIVGVGGTPALPAMTLYNEAGTTSITTVPALRVRINGGAWQTLAAAGLSISQPSNGVLQVTGLAGTESSIEWAFEHEQPGEPYNVQGTVSAIYVRSGTAPANTSLPGIPLAATRFENPVVTA